MYSPSRSKRNNSESENKKGVTWVTDPTHLLEPKVAESGPASYTPVTIIEVFKDTLQKHGHRNALYVERNHKWITWTWSEYYNDCMKFAKYLHYLQVDIHKIVNIIGFNSPEWFIANCGAILAGSIAAGIYSTNKDDACFYISNHYKAEVIVCEDIFQLAKYEKSASKLKWAKPCLKRYLVSHIKGEALEVTPDHWDTVAMLPLARFQKQSITEVYKQSRKKVNG